MPSVDDMVVLLPSSEAGKDPATQSPCRPPLSGSTNCHPRQLAHARSSDSVAAREAAPLRPVTDAGRLPSPAIAGRPAAPCSSQDAGTAGRGDGGSARAGVGSALESLHRGGGAPAPAAATAVACSAGFYPANDPCEDRHLVLYDADLDVHLFLVIDGHGSDYASDYCIRHLPRLLFHKLRLLASDGGAPAANAPLHADAGAIVDAITQSFRDCEGGLFAAAPSGSRRCKPYVNSGCCVVAALLVARRLFVGNVGDCRVTLVTSRDDVERQARVVDYEPSAAPQSAAPATDSPFVPAEATLREAHVAAGVSGGGGGGGPRRRRRRRRGGGSSPRPGGGPAWRGVPLTVDHSCVNAAEVAALRRRCRDPRPVRLPANCQRGEGPLRVAGSLTVTRALGDFYLKRPECAAGPSRNRVPYVTCTPQVTVVDLNEEDHMLVIATDGVWERLDNGRVANLLAEYVTWRAPASSPPKGVSGAAAAVATDTPELPSSQSSELALGPIMAATPRSGTCDELRSPSTVGSAAAAAAAAATSASAAAPPASAPPAAVPACMSLSTPVLAPSPAGLAPSGQSPRRQSPRRRCAPVAAPLPGSGDATQGSATTAVEGTASVEGLNPATYLLWSTLGAVSEDLGLSVEQLERMPPGPQRRVRHDDMTVVVVALPATGPAADHASLLMSPLAVGPGDAAFGQGADDAGPDTPPRKRRRGGGGGPPPSHQPVEGGSKARAGAGACASAGVAGQSDAAECGSTSMSSCAATGGRAARCPRQLAHSHSSVAWLRSVEPSPSTPCCCGGAELPPLSCSSRGKAPLFCARHGLRQCPWQALDSCRNAVNALFPRRRALSAPAPCPQVQASHPPFRAAPPRRSPSLMCVADPGPRGDRRSLVPLPRSRHTSTREALQHYRRQGVMSTSQPLRRLMGPPCAT